MSNTRDKAIRGETVTLSIQYYGIDGLPSDADAIPEITIYNPDDVEVVGSTSTGVTRASEGLYTYDYDVGAAVEKGLWEDKWVADVDGMSVTNTFSFLVSDSASALEGSAQLGDEVVFDFSQEELKGLNILLKYLKARLRSSGKKPKRDSFGAFVEDGNGDIVYEDCNVFSDEVLACMLCSALSEFNMVPFFTSYSFGDQILYTLFSQAIVEGAMIMAMASQSLVEKGRDFTVSDGGISYQPPQLGDFLASQYNNWLSNYRERLKFIKNNIRPGPQGYGTFTNLASGAPAFTRLRHLRSRRII